MKQEDIKKLSEWVKKNQFVARLTDGWGYKCNDAVWSQDLIKKIKRMADKQNDIKQRKKKLILIMDEKDPTTDHICYDGGCPFFASSFNETTVCYNLWNNSPGGMENKLACLCNFYDTRNIKMIELTDSESIKAIEAVEKIHELR